MFGAAAAVLMLEILAGRLMAPYVGVSLETFTGIIGTVLGGIALGSAVGGRLADRRDPIPLIAFAYGLGGILAWASVPIVTALGPAFDTSPPGIVLLAGVAFFAPAAVLSAVTPLAAKAQLSSLDQTGTVVGDLSAAGTAGALVGTFLTGFVLVAALPTRWIILIIGAALILGACVLTLMTTRTPPPTTAVVIALLALAGAAVSDGRCDEETAYSCVRIEVDEANPGGRSLYINYLRNSYIDLDDPTHLEFRYIRLFGAVVDALPAGPIRAVHVGGAGFGFPTYVAGTRPGSDNLVLELDGQLVEIAERELGLTLGPRMRVSIGDARTSLVGIADNSADLIVGDAFSGIVVPWHLTTSEVMAEYDRILVDGGVYLMNLIDGGDSEFARAEMATLAEHFDHVAVMIPPGGVPNRPVNHVLIASDLPFQDFAIDGADGTMLSGHAADQFIGGARVLTDDFAPVDQLTMNE